MRQDRNSQVIKHRYSTGEETVRQGAIYGGVDHHCSGIISPRQRWNGEAARAAGNGASLGLV